MVQTSTTNHQSNMSMNLCLYGYRSQCSNSFQNLIPLYEFIFNWDRLVMAYQKFKKSIELASLISYQVLRSPTSSVTFKKGRNKHNKYKVCVCVYTRTYTYVTFQYLFVCKIYVCVHICIYVNDDHRSFPHPHGPWGISKTPKLLRFRTNVGLFEVQCHTSANLRSLGAIQKTVLRDLYLSN